MNVDRRQKIVGVWSERAWAYNQLIEDWHLFTDLADRLVSMIEAPAMESVMDLGAGTGLLAQRILDIYPGAELHLVDPSEAMLALAERRLGHKARYHQCNAEGPLDVAVTVSTAMASASMHLADLEQVLAQLSESLRPGGAFAFNLWWHSFSDTALDGDMKDWWRPAMDEILEQDGYRAPKWPEPTLRRPHSRNSLREMGKRHGFEVESVDIDTDRVSKHFSVDFMAMDKTWPLPGLGGKRKDILQRLKDEIGGDEEVRTVRILMRKDAV